ncbi:hypothetical protein KR074_010042 [Drosophila pseudoananassae]|nr:hypothetical protein KR074_010042 [Drosophila pseudoananassae]
MGSSTRTWILLGLMAGVATLSGAAKLPQEDDQRIIQNNGNTYLSNGAGQIIRRADGKTVLIGSDGRSIVTDTEDSSEEDGSNTYYGNNNNNNVIINGETGNSIVQSYGHSFIYGDGNQGGSYINSNGRTIRIVNGAIELTENGKTYTFQPKARGVATKETVDVNGQPAEVEYTDEDIVVELADHTVIAKIGGRTFVGDRYSFEHREQLEADARNLASRIHEEVNTNLKKTMEDLQANLQNTFANIRF